MGGQTLKNARNVTPCKRNLYANPQNIWPVTATAKDLNSSLSQLARTEFLQSVERAGLTSSKTQSSLVNPLRIRS